MCRQRGNQLRYKAVVPKIQFEKEEKKESLVFRKFWGGHGDVDETASLLEYDTMSIDA
jgi:hypothetical protein